MLTDSINHMGENAANMRLIIENLEMELDKKDKAIQQLQEELQKRDANIAQLHNKINEMGTLNTQLTTKVQEQEHLLYDAFILMGQRKALKEGGFIRGGGLSKIVINESTMDKEKFTKVDIRELTEWEIPSKSPKLVTSAPKTSYKLTKGEDKSVLTIIDANAFWKRSRYLIILL